MKILMISSDTAVVKGIDGAFFNTLRGFSKFWERIDIICPSAKEIKRKYLFGNVFFHSLRGNRWLAPLLIKKIGQKICSDQKINLIIAHSYGLQLMALGGYWLARSTGLPIVIEVHHIEGHPRAANPLYYLLKLLSIVFLNFVKNKTKAFRVVNNIELPAFLRAIGISQDKIQFIPAIYLDKNVFSPQDIEKKYDLVFVGRLVANKGLPILVKAFGILKKQLPNVKLVIVGQGPKWKWLEKKVFGQNITLIKRVPTLADIAKIYNQSRIVVCSSLAEGGPRFVVEAMACGLPAVSTPIGLMKELIKDGENGFLCSWSSSEMAEKIRLLLTGNDIYKQCSVGALQSAGRFDYDSAIKFYAETYKKLL